MKVVSVGIDWGGTWIRAAALDREGRLLFRWKEKSPNASRLLVVLRGLLKRRRLKDLPFLALGGKGIWEKEARRRWWHELKPMAARVYVASDVEIAHRGAFNGEPGVLILAGTGSIALGICPDGRQSRAGGLGPERGDEGSGFWIGIRYLALPPGERSKDPLRLGALRGAEERVREVASLAQVVMNRAKRSNRACLDIVQQAQDHLSWLILQAARPLWKQGTVPVSWAGGLMDDPFFRKGVFEKAKNALKTRGLRLKVVKPRCEPARGAALLCQSFKTKK